MTSRISAQRAVALVLSVVLLLSTALLAGLRGSGPYNGVVLFDRWDGCYLYSGIYLMYVSEKVKEGLRPYHGDFVLLDVLEVYQPINPGDGLVKGYGKVELGKSQHEEETPLEDVHMTITAEQHENGIVRFRVVLTDDGAKSVVIETSELALTLLKKKGESENDWPMPSDGPSYALITRQSLVRLLHHDDSRVKILGSGRLRDRYELGPGKTTAFEVEFRLPAGEYDFVAGYGGGVHESRLVVSNMIAFDVDRQKRAQLASVPGRY
jgi:hypothetical protein